MKQKHSTKIQRGNKNNTGTEEIQSNPRKETIRTQHKTQERHKRTNKDEKAMARTTQTKRKRYNIP